MREAKISEFMADITDSEKITRFEKAMRRTLRPTIRIADFLLKYPFSQPLFCVVSS